ncbi:MAG: hypothetical protein MR283_04975 [Erysipelotrichaceae bacterium]|nr:hypothetical protein [Erysipelotrichaceae bacterium]MDY6034384.1 hypothetical protein [Bulleidia sp.]
MKQSFIVSYLTFYLKATVLLEGDFIKVSNPNTILKLIPLGSRNKTIPVDQVVSVDDSFRLDFKSFVWGIIFAIVGFTMMKDSLVVGLLVALYGALTVLSSFQTYLTLSFTSGDSYTVNAVVFEKENLLSCKATIEALIQRRYNNTNNSANTDRIIEALNKK